MIGATGTLAAADLSPRLSSGCRQSRPGGSDSDFRSRRRAAAAMRCLVCHCQARYPDHPTATRSLMSSEPARLARARLTPSRSLRLGTQDHDTDPVTPAASESLVTTADLSVRRLAHVHSRPGSPAVGRRRPGPGPGVRRRAAPARPQACLRPGLLIIEWRQLQLSASQVPCDTRRTKGPLIHKNQTDKAS
jgi:hypothetical protein